MSTDGLPAPDLSRVFLRQAPAQVVPAIPLEPAARIVRMYPPLSSPFRQALAGVHAEIVQGAVPARRRELRPREPTRGKLVSTIGELFAAEHAEFEHQLGCQIGPELRVEI